MISKATILRPISALVLAFAGFILMALGIYFIFFRPSLLPEDARYIGASLGQLQTVFPGLTKWLSRVFWVMGGHMFAAGLLTVYLAMTAFRARVRGAAVVAAVAGITSIGLMAAVNFLIHSDFRWLIFSFALPYGLALILYRTEARPD